MTHSTSSTFVIPSLFSYLCSHSLFVIVFIQLFETMRAAKAKPANRSILHQEWVAVTQNIITHFMFSNLCTKKWDKYRMIFLKKKTLSNVSAKCINCHPLWLNMGFLYTKNHRKPKIQKWTWGREIWIFYLVGSHAEWLVPLLINIYSSVYGETNLPNPETEIDTMYS